MVLTIMREVLSSMTSVRLCLSVCWSMLSKYPLSTPSPPCVLPISALSASPFSRMKKILNASQEATAQQSGAFVI